MSKKTLNKNLHKAKNAKKDEFYTQLPDIERELNHYTKHFKGKVVLCNCDDPRVSNFFHYFSFNFERLKLDATAKSPKNAAKTTATLQNQGGKILLTLASNLRNLLQPATKIRIWIYSAKINQKKPSIWKRNI